MVNCSEVRCGVGCNCVNHYIFGAVKKRMAAVYGDEISKEGMLVSAPEDYEGVVETPIEGQEQLDEATGMLDDSVAASRSHEGIEYLAAVSSAEAAQPLPSDYPMDIWRNAAEAVVPKYPVKKKASKVSKPVEIIICQGRDTVLPKTRSSAERKYICNGHAIHRVTFWRHRKQGCPHHFLASDSGDLVIIDTMRPTPKKRKGEDDFIPEEYGGMPHPGQFYSGSEAYPGDTAAVREQYVEIPGMHYQFTDGGQYSEMMEGASSVQDRADLGGIEPHHFEEDHSRIPFGMKQDQMHEHFQESTIPAASQRQFEPIPPYDAKGEINSSFYYSSMRPEALNDADISSPISGFADSYGSGEGDRVEDESDFLEDPKNLFLAP
jgi:hypothetical protein